MIGKLQKGGVWGASRWLVKAPSSRRTKKKDLETRGDGTPNKKPRHVTVGKKATEATST